MESDLGFVLKHRSKTFTVKDALQASTLSKKMLRLWHFEHEHECDVSEMEESDVVGLCKFLNGEEYEKSARMIAVEVEWESVRLIEECSVGREVEGLEALESIGSVSRAVECRLWRRFVASEKVGSTKSVVVARRVVAAGVGECGGSQSDGGRFIVSQCGSLGVECASSLVECLDLGQVEEECLVELAGACSGLGREACRGEVSRRRVERLVGEVESLRGVVESLVAKADATQRAVEAHDIRHNDLEKRQTAFGQRCETFENDVKALTSKVANECAPSELVNPMRKKVEDFDLILEKMKEDVKQLQNGSAKQQNNNEQTKVAIQNHTDDLKALIHLSQPSNLQDKMVKSVLVDRQIAEQISDEGCFSREYDGTRSGMMRGLFDGIQTATGKLVSESAIVEFKASSTQPATNVTSLTNYNIEYAFYSEDVANSHFEIDFKSARIQVTGYAIRTYVMPAGNEHLKSWVVEGKDRPDGKWEGIDEVRDDSSLNNANTQQYFPLKQKSRALCAIRLRQTGPNHNGTHKLKLNCFELFGRAQDLVLSECSVLFGNTTRRIAGLVGRVIDVEDVSDPLCGLFYQIERHLGQGADEAGLVSLSCSGTGWGEVSDIIQPTAANWGSTDTPNSQFAIKFEKGTMEIIAYTIRTFFNIANLSHMKSWIVEGLVGDNWIRLDERNDDPSLNDYAAVEQFTLSSRSQPVNGVRVRMTGPNWKNDNWLNISRFELFGCFTLS